MSMWQTLRCCVRAIGAMLATKERFIMLAGAFVTWRLMKRDKHDGPVMSSIADIAAVDGDEGADGLTLRIDDLCSDDGDLVEKLRHVFWDRVMSQTKRALMTSCKDVGLSGKGTKCELARALWKHTMQQNAAGMTQDWMNRTCA